MRHETVLLAWAAAFALALPASAIDGFVVGLEGQYGSWNADPAVLSEKGNIHPHVARGFSAPIHENGVGGLNLHLGWNVLGWASLEAVVHGSVWAPFDRSGTGGAGFLGARATYFPLQHFLPEDRQWDVGVELGAGYSIVGGPDYGMDGKYLATAITGEFYPLPWLSVAAGYRHFFAFYDRFYYDFADDITSDVDGFTAGWGAFFLGVRFHLTTPGKTKSSEDS